MHRTKDIITEKNDLEVLYTHKNFPIFMGCVDQNITQDEYFDLSVSISKSSGFIQLYELPPIEKVYFKSHGSGTIGKSWEEHHEQFSKFICKNNIKNVLEIGGYKKILYNKCKNNIINIDWTIVDPNVEVNNQSVKCIKSFFDANFNDSIKYNTIIHSHLFEHVYDINLFFKKIKSILELNGFMIFSVPNMFEMISRKYFQTLSFEHTFLLTEYYIEKLMEKYNFEIVEKNYFKDDHSIFYCVKHVNYENKNIHLDDFLYSKNKNLLQNHINFHIDNIKKINKLIEDKTDVYLFGAHVSSQYMINYGLNISNIKYIIDNDFEKENKRLYGTNLIVKHPSYIKNDNSPIVIIKSGTFNNEIKYDILTNVNPNTIFL
jgi:hypothetical protein